MGYQLLVRVKPGECKYLYSQVEYLEILATSTIKCLVHLVYIETYYNCILKYILTCYEEKDFSCYIYHTCLQTTTMSFYCISMW